MMDLTCRRAGQPDCQCPKETAMPSPQPFSLQVPEADSKVFKAFVDTLGYPYVDESSNPVYQLFLR